MAYVLLGLLAGILSGLVGIGGGLAVDLSNTTLQKIFDVVLFLISIKMFVGK